MLGRTKRSCGELEFIIASEKELLRIVPNYQWTFFAQKRKILILTFDVEGILLNAKWLHEQHDTYLQT